MYCRVLTKELFSVLAFCLPASQPAIRPTSARRMDPVFSGKSGDSRLKHESVVPKNVYPLCHSLSFDFSFYRLIF